MEKASNSHLRTGRFVRRPCSGISGDARPEFARMPAEVKEHQEMQSRNYDIGEVITGEFYAN